MIVVDASIVVQTLLQLDGAAAIESRLDLAGGSLHAPHILELEVANAFRKLASRRLIDGAQSSMALGHLRGFGVKLYPHGFLLERIWSLRHNLTPNDASYIVLAEMLDAPLLTRDRRLAATTGHNVRFEVFA